MARASILLALLAPASSLVPARLPAKPPSRVVVASSSAEIESFMDSTLGADDTKEAESLADFSTMSSGLKFKDAVVGAGPSPKPGDELEVHYCGWYYAGSTQGVKFDDSKDRDAAKGLVFEYGIAPIIEGWREGLETMKGGGKRTLVVPPAATATRRSAPGRPPIPANSELRFDLELVNVNNDLIRKARRAVGDFLRPPGNQYVTADEKSKLEAGTMEKPLLERLFNQNK
ncbi:PFAM peptidylprolyl isomerase FKBP-type [Aureococcus anophagefferens]|nr:PFAM peptidylprolyl isomerase FKBP-type [Aureococcus anophagefferens]